MAGIWSDAQVTRLGRWQAIDIDTEVDLRIARCLFAISPRGRKVIFMRAALLAGTCALVGDVAVLGLAWIAATGPSGRIELPPLPLGENQLVPGR